ncbi:hypothetical protein CY35_12G013100 [Sphagnum magellanicum]|nr:hypothetical protein CY35_12G013100 [Sphagnum magellanicum]
MAGQKTQPTLDLQFEGLESNPGSENTHLQQVDHQTSSSSSSSRRVSELPQSNNNHEKQLLVNLVKRLYDAIRDEDVTAIQVLLAPELDWWYHGPYGHQHMKFLLTGITRFHTFGFIPTDFWVIGNRVFVEGHGLIMQELPPAATTVASLNSSSTARSSWVHVWTVKDKKVLVVLREYVNTAIIVTSVTTPCINNTSATTRSSDCINDLSCSDSSETLWQSSLARTRDENIPGIVLAIEVSHS